MNHASLFTGIGGFDLAASWMGWNNVFQCEIDPFCQKVLRYHFPETVLIGDIKKAKFKRDERGNLWIGKRGIVKNAMQGGCLQRESDKEGAKIREQRDAGTRNTKRVYLQEDSEEWLTIPPIDIISGGFPCQPFSMAGKRKGTDDPRHLWPEMLRTIREIQPRFVVGENVGGLINWSGGLVFEQVQADMENEGYEVQAFVLPACAVNAPHRRDRVWIVAHRSTWDAQRGDAPSQGECKCTTKRGKNTRTGIISGQDFCTGVGEKWDYPCGYISGKEIRPSPDTEITGSTWKFINRSGKIQPDGRDSSKVFSWWDQFPTQPPVRSRNDGFSGQLDGITVSKLRNESIKAAGNAIVPQVAFEIFKAIQAYEDSIDNLWKK